MITYFKKLKELYTNEGARYAFELIIKDLLNSELGIVRSVSLYPGDNGIECYQGNLEEKTVIFQCKYFPDLIENSQKDQIRDSFNKISKNTNLKCEKWILCLPKDLNYEENIWFDQWRKKQSIPIELYDESYFRNLLNKHTSIRDNYFQNTNTELLKNIITELCSVNRYLENLITKPKIPNLKLGIITNENEYWIDNITLPPFNDPILIFDQIRTEKIISSKDDAIKYIKSAKSLDKIPDDIESLSKKLYEEYNKSYADYELALETYSRRKSTNFNESYIVFYVENNGNIPASNIRVSIQFPDTISVLESEFNDDYFSRKKEKNEIQPSPPNIDKILNNVLEDDGTDFPNLTILGGFNKFDFTTKLSIPDLHSKNAVRGKIHYNKEKHTASFWLNRVSHGGGYDTHTKAILIELRSSEISPIKYKIICDEYEDFVEDEIKIEFSTESVEKKPFNQFK